MSASAIATRAPISEHRMSAAKIVFTWIGLALIAFPLAGYAGWGVAGHVDGVVPALIGGAITGAGIGLVQWMFMRRDLGLSPLWIAATCAGLAAGLVVGSAVVNYEVSAGDLAVMGAISGVPVGIAQGFFLRGKFTFWHVWMIAMPVMFALAWVTSESIGIDVANQFTVFGASGSIVFGLLAGLIMMLGKRTHDVQ
jgi:hypothetical protein